MHTYESRHRPLHIQHALVPELSVHWYTTFARAAGATPALARLEAALLVTLRGAQRLAVSAWHASLRILMFLEVLRRCVSALDSSRAQCTCWPARLVVGSSVLHTDSALMNDVCMCGTAPSRVRVRRTHASVRSLYTNILACARTDVQQDLPSLGAVRPPHQNPDPTLAHSSGRNLSPRWGF